MSTKLIISDLHLADGTTILDCFGERQQSVFDGLLTSAISPDSPLGTVEQIELIINGDCFDLLVTTPYNSNKIIDEVMAVQKIDRIIAAHRPFFAMLHLFITTPGRRITFITGNHDLELCVAGVRRRITRAITENDVEDEDERIFFCPTRFYKPIPSLYIEHGNFYDFYNHAQQGLWDTQGNVFSDSSMTVARPVGSLYYQCASHLISTYYAYFDHFDPSVSIINQFALLCLFNPGLVKGVTRDLMPLLSYSRQSLANLVPGESHDPVRLFEGAMQDLAAFQADMIAQKRDWTPVPSRASSSSEEIPIQSEMELLLQARAALTLPLVEATKVLCKPFLAGMDGNVTTGMLSVLENDPKLRLVVAGHTHHMRAECLSSGGTEETSSRMYFNTSSWTAHYAPPTSDEITPELVAWLHNPDWTSIPLRDTTQFLFVKVVSEGNDGDEMNAQLCEWQGGVDGSYRVLVQA